MLLVVLNIQLGSFKDRSDRQGHSKRKIMGKIKLNIAQQEPAKTMKKKFENKIISYLPTLIFSRY
jgi:hypothetical protein